MLFFLSSARGVTMRKSSRRQDVEVLAWKPRLKNAPNRGRSQSTSGTMNVADQALSAMRQIDQRRTADGEVDDAYLNRLAGRFTPSDSVGGNQDRRQVAVAPRRRRPVLMVAGALCLVGAGAVSAGGLWRASRHTVAGKVWLDRQPFGAAELRFHPTGDAESSLTTIAANNGTFELKSISAGRYRVTVHSPAGSSVVRVASGYSKPETTPFQLHVNRDVESLQLYAFKVLPKPRKVAWTPGID